jgi:predicted NACHT family NTPase
MPNYGLIDYLVDENSLALDGDKQLAKKIVVRLLSLGSVVLIFDGLDEILDVEPRREIVTFIEQFANIYAGCPILVTSRSVGYRDAPMSTEFEFYDLLRFNTTEVQIFAQNLIKQVGRLKIPEAKEKSLAFTRQTDSIAQDLRENPLYAWIDGLHIHVSRRCTVEPARNI